MIISPTHERKWTNRHETFTQDIQELYDLGNEDTGDNSADYNDSTNGFQGLIRKAMDARTTLRALGGEWSWSKVAATNGILLNTKPLNITFRMRPENVSDSYALKPDDLYFSQCGTSVKELNDRLKTRGRSLKTSGASNGQTIAGALSTGTHGSAIDIGSIPDFVVGLHLIVSPTRHIWLERKTYPVASDAFVNRIAAERISNDEFFNAALVCFGSFGIIHGVMLETVPLFLYECHRLRVPLGDDLYRLMATLNFNDPNLPALPHGSKRPYHYQTLINQYDKSNQAYVTIMYERNPGDPNNNPAPPSKPGFGPGDDAPTFIGNLTQVLPKLVPTAVNTLIAAQYKPYSNQWGTHGQIFFNTDTHGKVMSSALGISLDRVAEVRELFLKLVKSDGPVAGVLAFRFVKGTKATLGFTRFPETCVVELDCVFSNQSSTFYSALWKQMRAANIPFTFHWGKLLDLNRDTIREMYTRASVDSWINARQSLMNDPDAMNVFTNDLMRQCGLDSAAIPAPVGAIT